MGYRKLEILQLAQLLLLVGSCSQSSSSSSKHHLHQLIKQCKHDLQSADNFYSVFDANSIRVSPVITDPAQAVATHNITAAEKSWQQWQQLVWLAAMKLAHSFQEDQAVVLQACQEAVQQLMDVAAIGKQPAAEQANNMQIQLDQQQQQQRSISLQLLSSTAESNQAGQPNRPKRTGIQPRLSIHTISDMPDRRLYKMLYLMALDELLNHGPETGDSSYHAIAGIHGATSPYNGYSPHGGRFCVHDDISFGPWHRPYVLLFEQLLRKACKSAVQGFRDVTLKADAQYTCDTMRAPYWDYTDSRTPDLLTRSTVMVYSWTGRRRQMMNNPLLTYCFRAVAEMPSGTRYPGTCVRRSSDWAQAMSANAWSFREQALGFLSSSSWYCTNRATGDGCPGNLEALHNNVHNVIGGDMATLSTAGWDPIFWLHHANVDRLLFLHQASTGEYIGNSWFIPFPQNAACGARTTECNYIYEDRTPQLAAEINAEQQQQGDDKLLHFKLDESLGDPTSLPALNFLQRYLKQLQGGYGGYRWSIVIDGVNPHALKPHTHALHVLINYGRCKAAAVHSTATAPVATDGQSIDVSAVRRSDGYCGSNAGFVTADQNMAHDKNTTAVISINGCLQRCGLDPDITPLNASDPTEGPHTKPLNRSMVQVICIRQSPEGQATDCTNQIAGSLAVQLGWSVMSPRFVAAAQMFAPVHFNSTWTLEGLHSHVAHSSNTHSSLGNIQQGQGLAGSRPRQYQYSEKMEL